ncbi:MAG: sodium:proton antiporter, partial [Gemmatimonadota bacterium]
MESLLIQLAAVVVLGIGATWLSWRFHLPSILLLLVVGFLAGSVTGLLDPDALLGDLLFPVVSLSVAVILFEGGLSLDIAELRDIGRVLRNLITIGVLVTWVGATLLARVLLGFDWDLATLLGAILVVTGPTVIVPLMRHVRPSHRVGSAIKWEGIVNDPLGAILAVLVFEVIIGGGQEFSADTVVVVLTALAAGTILGLAGAALLVVALRRYWIPDFLQNPGALAVALAVFATANLLQEESGLLAVTVMGSALASQKLVSVRHIVEFKENLRVLLISILFIVLAARIPVSALLETSVSGLLFLGGLIVLVRPAAVALATLRTRLNWRERCFLGFMAPRGIVAAAVSSIFALELVQSGHQSAEQLIPITFLVIVGTVLVYGVAAAPVARWLRVASPDPQGLLIVGADPWIRSVAELLQREGVEVLLVDSNWAHVAAARQSGLRAQYGNVLDEQAMDALDLDGIGGLLAVTSNDEVNALAALHFGEVFGRARVYQ